MSTSTTRSDPPPPGPPPPGPPDPAPLHPAPRSRRRWALVLIAVVVVLVLGGLTLVGLGLVDDRTVAPPAPTLSAGAAPTPARADSMTVGAAARPGSPPMGVDVPGLGIRSAVNPVGQNPDGSVEVPAPGPLYDQAAWYRYSVTPGEIGPSVLLGHVDSARSGPSVFYDLAKIETGSAFTVNRADGSVLSFRVDSVQRYPKDAFPTQTVYGGTTRPEIRLVTCGGEFDRLERSYRDNIVVFGHLIA